LPSVRSTSRRIRTTQTHALTRIFLPNVWPDSPPQLRTVWENYFSMMHALSNDIMRIFAVALGLPENGFAGNTDKCISLLRAQNYPEQAVAPVPGQLRAGNVATVWPHSRRSRSRPGTPP
jgi:isopenicillin N synthase-like dioxygenase